MQTLIISENERDNQRHFLRLSDADMRRAATEGSLRRTDSIIDNLSNEFSASIPQHVEPWQRDIESRMSEYIVGRELGQRVNPINTYKMADVGRFVQVRWSDYLNAHLIVRPNDKDGEFFVLVGGLCPNYWIVGWIGGLEAKQSQWLRSPGGGPPCYYVPQLALQPFALLKEMSRAWPK